MPRWFSRYVAGDHEAVWAELTGLGSDIRVDRSSAEARQVARETMRRVRDNVTELIARLHSAGYAFEADPLVPLDVATRDRLDEFEVEIGPLPLSLRAFYENVGTVDLRQSHEQIVHWAERETQEVDEVLFLGEYDPIVVETVIDPDPDRPDPDLYYFAPDEFHKANYSGGENYHVRLPDPAADFRIWGMYGLEEYFVTYLRASFAYGGFRGRLGAEGERAWKDAPDIRLPYELARGLIPI
jgi:hypothetical protein